MSSLSKVSAAGTPGTAGKAGQAGQAAPTVTADLPGVAARRKKRVATFSFLAITLIGAVIVSAAVGQYSVSPAQVIRGFWAHFQLAEPLADSQVNAVLWEIRFPRIVLGLLVGASLGVAGAVMQAIFSNPLAEPGIIGVSSGAAVGAAIMIVVAPAALGGFSVPLAAFISGLTASFAVYFLARSNGKAEVITLVLTGIAVTAICGAITAIATYIAPVTARDQIVFWQMGSLNGATWQHVGTVAIVMGIGLVGAIAISGRLDALALGEKAAGHVGINVARLRLFAITMTALLTAAAVCYAGIIAFVGLIVPHVLRLVIGPTNRVLIPAALLGGALLLTLSDIAARNLIPFADIPIGIFTALVGGPTFFILLRRGMHLSKLGAR